jgi:hypothetical protein
MTRSLQRASGSPAGADHRTDKAGANDHHKLTKIAHKLTKIAALARSADAIVVPVHAGATTMTLLCVGFVVWLLVVAAALLVPTIARLVGAVVLILIVIAAAALAEPRRPPPVPQIGSGCPPGYSSNPTSGTCAPSATTRCRAFLSPGGSCPTGWTYSPTSRMCVEVGC